MSRGNETPKKLAIANLCDLTYQTTESLIGREDFFGNVSKRHCLLLFIDCYSNRKMSYMTLFLVALLCFACTCASRRSFGDTP